MHYKMRILVGYDASLQSKKALNEAITIAKAFSGYIKVIHVYGRGMKEKAEGNVIEVREILNKEKGSYDVEIIQGSDPAKTLEEIAKRETFDLIIVGSRGLGATVSMLLGSVSRQVISNAPCNVLVAKK